MFQVFTANDSDETIDREDFDWQFCHSFAFAFDWVD